MFCIIIKVVVVAVALLLRWECLELKFVDSRKSSNITFFRIQITQSLLLLFITCYFFVNMKSKRKTKNMNSKISFVQYFVMHWTINDRVLTWKLINVFKKNEKLKKNIWSLSKKIINDVIKIKHCEKIIFELLIRNAIFVFYIISDYDENEISKKNEKNRRSRNQLEIRHYVINFKFHLTDMQKIWKTIHELLDEIEQKFNSVENIWKNTSLMQIWRTKMTKTCSFYYELKELLSERFLMIKDAVFNSNIKFRIDDALSFNRQENIVITFSNNIQINKNFNEMLKFSKFDELNDDEIIIDSNLRELSSKKTFTLQNFRSANRMSFFATSVTTSVSNTKRFSRSRFRRTRESINTLSDFVEKIRAFSTITVNTKRKKNKKKKDRSIEYQRE